MSGLSGASINRNSTLHIHNHVYFLDHIRSREYLHNLGAHFQSMYLQTVCDSHLYDERMLSALVRRESNDLSCVTLLRVCVTINHQLTLSERRSIFNDSRRIVFFPENLFISSMYSPTNRWLKKNLRRLCSAFGSDRPSPDAAGSPAVVHLSCPLSDVIKSGIIPSRQLFITWCELLVVDIQSLGPYCRMQHWACAVGNTNCCHPAASTGAPMSL